MEFKVRKIINNVKYEYCHSFLEKGIAIRYIRTNYKGFQTKIVKSLTKNFETQQDCVMYDVYVELKQ